MPASFSWRKAGTDWALHCTGITGPVLHVAPDRTHAATWRVRSLDGKSSDMASLSWARDAALSLGRRLIEQDGAESRSAGRPCVKSKRAAQVSPTTAEAL